MNEKACRVCGITKPLDAFSVSVGGLFGRHTYCKACRRDKARIKSKNAEAAAQRRATVKTCARCRQQKVASAFLWSNRTPDGLTSRCIDCGDLSAATRYANTPEIVFHRTVQVLLNAVPALSRGNLSPIVRCA